MKTQSILKFSFWDAWFMKIFRNFASMKFQILAMIYVLVAYGMFHTLPNSDTPYISAGLGCTLLGGGFVTLALGRIIANTSLVDKKDGEVLDTDK